MKATRSSSGARRAKVPLRSAKVARSERFDCQQTADATSTGNNGAGFATIPVELLSEILSQLPRPVDPLTTQPWHVLFSEADAEELYYWRRTLLCLSQTCQRWRHFFWPELWRRIEICEPLFNEKHEKFTRTHPGGEGAIHERHLNVELVRQLEVVTVRGPYLADYVK